MSTKEQKAKRQREWVQKNPEKKLANWLKHNYDLSLFEYTKIYHSQKGKCAICNTEISFFPVSLADRTRKASVDHDHSTGQVRGLLCGSCNRGLGFLKDSLVVITKACKYLKKYQ